MRYSISAILLAMMVVTVSLPANAGAWSDSLNRKYLNELKTEMTQLDTAYLNGEISEKEHQVRKETIMVILIGHTEITKQSRADSTTSSSGMSHMCKWAIQESNKSGIAVHCN